MLVTISTGHGSFNYLWEQLKYKAMYFIQYRNGVKLAQRYPV